MNFTRGLNPAKDTVHQSSIPFNVCQALACVTIAKFTQPKGCGYIIFSILSQIKRPWLNIAHGLCPPYDKTTGVEG
jgi:hypothetical protein